MLDARARAAAIICVQCGARVLRRRLLFILLFAHTRHIHRTLAQHTCPRARSGKCAVGSCVFVGDLYCVVSGFVRLCDRTRALGSCARAGCCSRRIYILQEERAYVGNKKKQTIFTLDHTPRGARIDREEVGYVWFFVTFTSYKKYQRIHIKNYAFTFLGINQLRARMGCNCTACLVSGFFILFFAVCDEGLWAVLLCVWRGHYHIYLHWRQTIIIIFLFSLRQWHVFYYKNN